MDLSVVIAALNEAENLPYLVRELRAALDGVTASYEVVVVDGGSRDGTAEVARSLGCGVVAQRTAGYGGALREGFAAARGEFICTLDADLSHPPTFISEMWRRREEGDLIIASRYVAGGSAEMPRLRAVLSRVLNRVFGELLTIPVGDISSGFRLYRHEALARFETSGRNFNVLQELLTGILVRGGRVLEVPFHYRPRVHGSSHARILKFGVSYLGSLWHLFFLRTALFRSDRARRLAPYLLVIAFAVGAAYVNALRNGAVKWDDDWLVFENPSLRSLDPASLGAMFDPFRGRAAYGSQYQPLSDLSYALDGAVFGWKDARYFHIQGILWHLLAAGLLFVLVNRHAGSAGIALVAALLFAVHPAEVEAVTWISGRRSAMAGALVLVAALAWLRYRESGRANAYAGSLVAAMLACLAKQSAVATPLILLALDLTAPASPAGSRPRRRLAALLPHFVLAAGFAAIFYFVGVREGVAGPHPLGLEGQLGAAFIGLAYYARLSVLPLWLRPSYSFVFVPGEFQWELVAGGAVLVAGVLAARALRARAPAATFGIAAAGAALVPSLTGTATQVVAERYVYLSAGFLAIAAATAFARLARFGPPPAELTEERALVLRRRALAAGFLALVVVLGAATHYRNRIWRDDVTLWADAVTKDLQNRIARRLLGRALMRRAAPGDFERAEAELRAAADLEAAGAPLRGPSQLPFILGNIAELCERRGAFDEAERLLFQALALAPSSERAHVQLGDFYRARGALPKARAVYSAFIDAHPAASAAARARLAEISPP